MKINGVQIHYEGFGSEPPSLDELAAYVEYVKARKEHVSTILVTNLGNNEVKLTWTENNQKFERIRRITGYLVGTLDRWGNAKQAEEKDRVKHELTA